MRAGARRARLVSPPGADPRRTSKHLEAPRSTNPRGQHRAVWAEA
nr:MAG TPA: hypothetical protein [Caudoviricetes sp.]